MARRLSTPLGRALLLWLAAVAVGAALVALPDSGARVVSLSSTHGPGVVDVAGAALATAGWLYFVARLWRVRARVPRRGVLLAVGSAAAAAAGWSILGDHGWWWVPAVLVVLGVQVVAALTVRFAHGRPGTSCS